MRHIFLLAALFLILLTPLTSTGCANGLGGLLDEIVDLLNNDCLDFDDDGDCDDDDDDDDDDFDFDDDDDFDDLDDLFDD